MILPPNYLVQAMTKRRSLWRVPNGDTCTRHFLFLLSDLLRFEFLELDRSSSGSPLACMVRVNGLGPERSVVLGLLGL